MSLLHATALPRRVRKYVRDCTDLSIEQIAVAIVEGRVELWANGEKQDAMSEETLVFPGDVVLLDGEALRDDKLRRSYVFNKPMSVTTTMSDPRGKQDLTRFLEPLAPGVFPLGRLDRETTGALLLSNDGDLTSAVLRPEHHLQKIYWLWLNESVSSADPRLSQWQAGMDILGRTARADDVSVLTVTEDMTELLVTLSQGINRQIRRMCRKSDFRLLHLHRRSIGPVSVSGMQLGQVRELDALEVEALWQSAGGRERIRTVQIAALKEKARLAREKGAPLLRLEAFFQ